MVFFLLAFKPFIIILLIFSELRTILNDISGVKYQFVVHFLICHVYSKVNDKQILLNPLPHRDAF